MSKTAARHSPDPFLSSIAAPNTGVRWPSGASPGPRSSVMILCPIALAIGCKKCPIFSFCPVKSVIGDQKEEEKPAPKTKAKAGRKG